MYAYGQYNNVLKHFYMSIVDAGSSLRWLSASNHDIMKSFRLNIGDLMLEECDPVVLVLVLTLVLVGRPSSGARGSKKSVLLAFLLSICHLQNYEEIHGEVMM